MEVGATGHAQFHFQLDFWVLIGLTEQVRGGELVGPLKCGWLFTASVYRLDRYCRISCENDPFPDAFRNQAKGFFVKSGV